MIPDRFRALDGASSDPVTAELLEKGVCIVRGAMPPPAIARMSADANDRFAATPFCEGDFHGWRTRRFHRVLARVPGAEALVLHADILAAATAILGLWCDFPELNLTQGVEVHPGAPAQIPHVDQSMWSACSGDFERSVNVIWPFGPFTPANGATRVWPGSHAVPRRAGEALGPPEVCAAEPGDAIVILGSTLHAAGANVTRLPRRAVIVSYCLGWLKAYENQSLAYPREMVRQWPPELARLVGYRWHRPNLGTYDGQCPSALLGETVPEHVATVDRLAPHHRQRVAAFAANPRHELWRTA